MKAVEIYTESGCMTCRQATMLLDEHGVDYDEIVVDLDQARRSEMVMRTMGKRLVPQVFIADEHVGGLDELMALEETGELGDRLESKN